MKETNINLIRKTFYLAIVFVFLLSGIFIFYACKEDMFDEIPKKSEMEQSGSLIERINIHMKNITSNMSLPNIKKTIYGENIKHSRLDIGLRYNPYEFTVHWDSIQIFKEKSYTTYIFAISPKKPIFSFLHTRLDADNQVIMSTAYFKLAIRITLDSIYSSIFTYLPEYKFFRGKGNKVSKLGYNLDGSSYSGVFLVSDLNGIFHFGKQYDNGVLKMYFFPRNSHIATRSLRQKVDTDEGVSVSLDLFNTSKADLQEISYYASEPGGGSSGNIYRCSICGNNVDACICNLGITVCRRCGKSISKCTCTTVVCSFCKRNPCICGDGGTGGEAGYGGAGSGSGGSGNNSGSGSTGSSDAHKTKKIFRNNKMSEDEWMELERMMEEIIRDCMGQALYNELVKLLDGKTLGIQIDPTKSGHFGVAEKLAFISLQRKESTHFLHEMFHAYQAYQETDVKSYNSSMLNREIEAHYAQYLYARRQDKYLGSDMELLYKEDPRYGVIREMEKYVDEKGRIHQNSLFLSENFIFSRVIPVFRKTGYVESSYPYDANRSLEQNLKSIKKLSKNC